MKNRITNIIIISALVLGLISSHAQKRQLVVSAVDTGIKIQPTMYGIFFEDINFAADGGLYAEMVRTVLLSFWTQKWVGKNPIVKSIS